MTRAAGTLGTSAVLAFVLVACSAADVRAQQKGHFRLAWNTRSAECATVHFLATGAMTWWNGEGSRRSSREAKLRVEARLDCEGRKLRIDVADSAGGGNLYILDGRQFHTCVRLPAGAWRVLSARRMPPDADWPLFYPFLLARGIVPLPPLSVPPTRAELAKHSSWSERAEASGGATTFTFEGKPALAVTIGHENHDLIASYRVTADGRPFLDVSMTYRPDNGVQRLDRFKATHYAPNGQPASRFEAQVTQWRSGAPLSAELFVPPRGADQLGKKLAGLLKQKLDIGPKMSLDEIERTLQTAFGQGIKVQLDRDAFAGRHEVKVDRLQFEPGQATLSDFLLHDLPRNRLDFYFDQDTVVIVPRSRAWSRAQKVGYSPADYNLTTGQLRDLIYETGQHADWSDVGGAASIVEDEEGRLNVFHTQSDHLRFLQRLADWNEQQE